MNIIKAFFISVVVFHLDCYQNKIWAATESDGLEEICNTFFNESIIQACQIPNSSQTVQLKNEEEYTQIYLFEKLECSNFDYIYRVFSENCNTSHQFQLETNETTLPECPENVTVTFDLNFCVEIKSLNKCPFLSDYTVQPFLTKDDDDENIIRLNITWINKKQAEKEINITSNSTNCAMIVHILNYTDNSFIFPGLDMKNPHEKVNFGCEYEIRFDGDNFTCTDIYSLPECIETACNCERFTDYPLEITSIEPDNDNIFTVRWANPGPDKITHVSYAYTYKGEDYHLIRYYPVVKNENLEENWSQLEFDNLSNDINQNYTLYAEFTNNYHCFIHKQFDFQKPYRSNKAVIFLVIIIIVGIIGWNHGRIKKSVHKIVKKVKLKFFMPQQTVEFNAQQMTMAANPHYISFDYQDENSDKFEIDRNRILIKQEIGSGAFGKVYAAKILGFDETMNMVAVKTLNFNATKEEMEDLKAEIEIFKKIGEHPNIVKLLGYCTVEEPYMMVMEFVPCGDLKNYLLELRTAWKNRKNNNVFFPDSSDGVYIQPSETAPSPTSLTSSRLPSVSDTISTIVEESLTPLLSSPIPEKSTHLEKILDTEELQNFAIQIAKGMAHLEQIQITHRDLAARNILINEYKVLKISDFGMSRTGPYINRRTKKLPLRWMALESITHQIYDSKSDVWSFGVVLYEIGTLGALPYDKVMDSFLVQYLQLGKRLERPEVCTDELYEIMEKCWAADPIDRPSFEELVDVLDTKKRRIYVDFAQLNPLYVFPPSELANMVKEPIT